MWFRSCGVGRAPPRKSIALDLLATLLHPGFAVKGGRGNRAQAETSRTAKENRVEYDVIIVGLGGMARPVPTPWPDVPVAGEVVADLVTTGATDFDLEFLSPARFTSPA